jgi:hypothetical protein
MEPKYTSKSTSSLEVRTLFENRRKICSLWYLEICNSRRCALLVSENVKENRVLFDTLKRAILLHLSYLRTVYRITIRG